MGQTVINALSSQYPTLFRGVTSTLSGSIYQAIHRVMGFKTKTHQTDHGPIEYLTTQPSKSKETIIFFHGFADSKHSFYGASLNLFRNYQIIIPDLPGFGKSFKQQSLTYDIESYCQWMVDWLKSLNIDKAHIVGNSLGGGIAISIAHMVPELVKSLTTINPAGVPLPGYPSLYQELFEGKNIWVMENRKEFDSFIERAFYKKVFIPWAIREKTFFEFLDNKTGTLEVGKKADITFLRNADLNLKNSFNPLHSIICYGHPGNVDTVVIEGDVMKQNGKLNFTDLDNKLSKLELSGRKIYTEFKAKAATADFG